MIGIELFYGGVGFFSVIVTMRTKHVLPELDADPVLVKGGAECVREFCNGLDVSGRNMNDECIFKLPVPGALAIDEGEEVELLSNLVNCRYAIVFVQTCFTVG